MLRLGRFSCVQSLGGNNQARKSEFRVVWKVLCNLMDCQHTHTHTHTGICNFKCEISFHFKIFVKPASETIDIAITVLMTSLLMRI